MFARSHDGTRIHYTVEGEESAPAVLFSNSLGTALGMWDGQVAALAPRFRILRYDARGHGRSEAPDGPYALDELGRDALAVLDAAGVERAHVVGLSMGGMVAMWLAANRPARVDRLVLSNTAAHFPDRTVWDARIDTVREKGMAGVVDGVVDRWFTKSFQTRAPERVAPIREMILATPPAGYMGCAAAIRDMDQRPSLRLIEAATLVIAGRHDPATTPAQAEEIREAIPGASLDVLDAAHLSNIEAEDRYNRALAEFLAG